MPGAQVIGIQIDVRENASAVAPRIAEQFERIGEAGAEAGQAIQDAFDTTKMTSQLAVFAEKIDKLYETKFGRQRELQMRYMELRNQQIEQRVAGQVAPEQRALERVQGGGVTVSRVAGQVAQAGQTGNVIQPGASVLETLSGTVSKAGPVGAVVAGAASLLAIGATITDQLVRTYEPFMSQLMDTTAAFGDLKKSAGENSLMFRRNLQDAGAAAAKFGYTLEVGSDILGQLAKGGMGRGAALGRENELFGYARGFGVQPGSLVAAQIMAQRYGQGNVLGLAAGGVGLSGMGAGRYEEYLNAMTSVFEDAIGKGVQRGFEDISGTLNFFSRLGPMWQGALGAQRLGTLNQAVGGATSLQNETDVLLYRAARQQVQGQAKGAFDYTDVMMQMEKGMTVPLFQSIYEQMKQMTGGSKTDMIEMLRQTFGINYSMATSLWQAGQPGQAADLGKLVAALPPPTAESDEMKLVTAEENLRLTIIQAGESLLGAKVELVSKMGEVVNWLAKQVGVDLAAQAQRQENIKVVAAASEFNKAAADKYTNWMAQTLEGGAGAQSFLAQMGGIGATGGGGAIPMMMDPNYITSSKMTAAQYKTNQAATESLIGMFLGLSEGQMGSLSSGKYSGQLQKTLQGIGNKDMTLQPEEIAAFYAKFKPLLDQVAKEEAARTASMFGGKKVGSIEALSKYALLSTGGTEGELEAAGKYGLQDLLGQYKSLQGPRYMGVFGKGGITAESESDYAQRIEKAKKLEAALTGLTTTQVESLVSSGKFGEMYSKGELNVRDVDALIKAIRDNTLALLTPSTVTVQGK